MRLHDEQRYAQADAEVTRCREAFLPIDSAAREAISQQGLTKKRLRDAAYAAWPGWKAAQRAYLSAVEKAEVLWYRIYPSGEPPET
jgi:hypothetical protein